MSDHAGRLVGNWAQIAFGPRKKLRLLFKTKRTEIKGTKRMSDIKASASGDVQKNWGWFHALGILMIIGGVSAVFAPFLVSVIVEQIVGISFVAGGGLMLVQVFSTKDGWNARLIYLILGLFTTMAGALLLFRPLEGLVALTLILIAGVFVSGLIRIAMGIAARPETGSSWVIFGGILSVIVSGYLMMNYPEISVALIGLMAGFSLIGEGAGYVRFAYGLKNNTTIAT